MTPALPQSRAVMEVPKGLEIACVRIARRETGIRFDRLGPGLIQSKERADDPRVQAVLADAPRWSFGSFYLIADRVTPDAHAMDKQSGAIAAAVTKLGWQGQKYWLTAGDKTLKDWSQRFLSHDLGLINDPGDYAITLKAAAADRGACILLGRSISVKQRFDYRLGDVGASINPVLAACLVRLIPQDLELGALDPTCGSGTLLFERLLFSNETGGHGIDVSPQANAVFLRNLAATGLKNVSFQQGTSTQADHWRPCSSVVSNLPFGLRVKQDTETLDALYSAILRNAHANLATDGRILLTSSYKRGLEQAEAVMAGKLRVLSKYRAEMGGLHYQIFVFAKAD